MNAPVLAVSPDPKKNFVIAAWMGRGRSDKDVFWSAGKDPSGMSEAVAGEPGGDQKSPAVATDGVNAYCAWVDAGGAVLGVSTARKGTVRLSDRGSNSPSVACGAGLVLVAYEKEGSIRVRPF